MTITKINAEGIYYIDDKGSSQSVGFSECSRNWNDFQARTGSISDEEKTDRVVGQRDRAPICYIELFTKPFTRFEFSTEDEIRLYDDIWKEIWKCGWALIDWS